MGVCLAMLPSEGAGACIRIHRSVRDLCRKTLTAVNDPGQAVSVQYSVLTQEL